MVKKACIRDMAMLEGPWRDLTEAKKQELMDHGLMAIRGCTRSMIMGNKADIKAILPEFEGKLEYLEGAHAYGRLLQVVSGQLSKTPGESQIVSQFKKSWQELCAHNPTQCSKLSYLYDSIIADNGLIRSRITHHLQPAFYETTARRMGEHERGDTMLFVAGAEKSGNKLNETSHHLLRQLASGRNHGIGRLQITHPDPQVARRLHAQCSRLKLTIMPELVDFDTAFANCEALMPVHRVFVGLPMDQYPEADKKIMHAWREREAFGGKLVHLGGASKSTRITRGEWSGYEFWNGVMPEEISAQQKDDKERNAALVDLGGQACLNCGQSRIEGKNPLSTFITLNPDDYAHRLGLNASDRQRG